jgi:hypothetical protein
LIFNGTSRFTFIQRLSVPEGIAASDHRCPISHNPVTVVATIWSLDHEKTWKSVSVLSRNPTGLTDASISVHCLATLSQRILTDIGSESSLPGLGVEDFHTPLARKRQLRPEQDVKKLRSSIGHSEMRQTVRSAWAWACCGCSTNCDGGKGFVCHPATRNTTAVMIRC